MITAPIIQRKTPSKYSVSPKNRPSIIEESLKALFQNKKVILFTNLISITGTCVDFMEDNICLSDAEYKLSTTLGDVVVEGKTEYMIATRQGKNLALLEN